MYSNIKWQSSTMQSHNYFCTNLIQNEFCQFVKSLFRFSTSLALINYTYVNMYIYTYIIYLVNCSLRLFTNVLAKNNLKHFDYGKFQTYKSRQKSIINLFYPFPNFSFIFPDSSVGKESACNAGFRMWNIRKREEEPWNRKGGSNFHLEVIVSPGPLPHSPGTGMKSFSRVLLCDSMDCSLPGSSVHGIFQARILERVAISFSRTGTGGISLNITVSSPTPTSTVWGERMPC